MKRYLWLLISTAMVAAGLLAAGTLRAQDGPIVTPADISTPTPVPPVLPTPTATPPRAAGSFPPSPRTMHLATDTPLTYTVRGGDTLFTVALETGIDLEDVPCAVGPRFTDDQPLVIGDVLSVPPANVLCHEVLSGDTLDTVAAAYRVAPEEIRALPWNGLIGVRSDGIDLRPGTHLRIPLPLPKNGMTQAPAADADFLAVMLNMPVDTSPFVVFADRNTARGKSGVASGPVPADWPYGSGHFAWPVYGWLSQSYRYDHRAVDVAAPAGTPITAADRGVVLRAGWNDQGYGRFVIIDHKIDYVTLY
ncbi:MAG: M23 family metallopeptidase, partial [Caldilineaceae bacterium]|nr:M23 family metallopeptidase [Caldilineaceae bacterium]